MTYTFKVHTSARIDQVIDNVYGKFVPCNFIGDFKDPFAAVGSIGIIGPEAALCLTGISIGKENPFFFPLILEDPDCVLSDFPISLTAGVLLRRPCGTVGLWFAMLNHLSDTHDEALSRVIEDALSGLLFGGPTVDVFQISEQEGVTLQ